MPRVSVITPCFNSARFISRTIASVAAQTFTDWEHIVVDDGSTDNSASVVEASLAANPQLKLLKKTNGGVSSARNHGYRACASESAYVLFLDADDCLEPRMFEMLVNYLDSNPLVGVAYCDYLLIDEDDVPIATPLGVRYAPSRFWVRTLSPREPETPFVSVYCMAPVMESLSLIRRSDYDRTPGWDESFGQFCEGQNLFLQMVLRAEIHFVPQVLYRYRQHSGQFTCDVRRKSDQMRKLYRLWSTIPDLPPEVRAQVAAARRFRARRLLPYLAWIEGGRCWRNGNIGAATVHFSRAIWRHVRSIFVYPYV